MSDKEKKVKVWKLTAEFSCDRLQDYRTPHEMLAHAGEHLVNQDIHNGTVREQKS